MFPVILPYIKQDLELSNVETATIVTANEVASGGLTVPSGIVADKYYKHRAIILGGAVALCGLAYFFVGFVEFSIAYFFVGFPFPRIEGAEEEGNPRIPGKHKYKLLNIHSQRGNKEFNKTYD